MNTDKDVVRARGRKGQGLVVGSKGGMGDICNKVSNQSNKITKNKLHNKMEFLYDPVIPLLGK